MNNTKKGIVMSLAFSFFFLFKLKSITNEHKNNNQKRRRSAFFFCSLLNRLGRVLACKQMVMNQNLNKKTNKE
jgi:hypothetical protein